MKRASLLAVLAALLALPQAAAQVTTDLDRRLGHKNREHRLRAIHEVAELGDKARRHVPALLDRLTDEDLEVGIAASRALARIRDVSSGRVLSAVGQLDGRARLLAVSTTARMRQQVAESDVADVGQTVAGFFSDADAELRREALVAITALPAPGDELLLAVFAADGDESTDVREQSHRTLRLLAGRCLQSIRRLLLHEKITGSEELVAAVSPHGAEGLPLLAILAKNPRPPVAVDALRAIGRQRFRAREVQPVVEEVCSSQSSEVRAAALAALGVMCSQDEPVPTPIEDALGSDDADIRAAGLSAAADAMRADQEALLDFLGEALHDPAPKVRRTAAERLVRISWSLPSFVEPLAADLAEPTNRSAAVEALVRCEHHARARTEEAAKSKDKVVAAAAVEVLSRIGGDQSKVARAAIKSLKSRDPAIRAHAMRSLGNLRDAAEPAISALARGLKKREDVIGAISALARIPGSAKKSGRALVKLLGHEDRDVRLKVLELLRAGPFHDLGKSAGAKILKMMEDPEVAWSACYTLTLIGLNTDEVVRKLVRAMRDESTPSREWVIWSIGWSEKPGVGFKPLIQFVASNAPSHLRVEAALAVERLCTGTSREKRLKKLLLEWSEDTDPALREYAFESLAGRFPDAFEADSDPSDDLRSDDPNKRRAAMWSLSRSSGDRSQKVIELLEAALDDPDRQIQRAATAALLASGDAGRGILIHGLEASSPAVRRAAVDGVADMRPVHPDLVPALLEIGKMRDSEARRNAARALSRVENVLPMLTEAADAANLEQRRMLVRAAIDLRGQAVELIERFAKDEDECVRTRATDALRWIR